MFFLLWIAAAAAQSLTQSPSSSPVSASASSSPVSASASSTPVSASTTPSISRSPSPSPSLSYKLTILFTCDVFGAIMPVDSRGSECNMSTAMTKPGECFGGPGRVSAYFEAVKAGQLPGSARMAPPANTLLLDMGNYHLGSSIFGVFKGNSTARTMAAVGYDLVCLDKQDFYSGQQSLARRMDLLQELHQEFWPNATVPHPKVLLSNMDLSRVNWTSPLLQDIIVKSQILEVGGLSVGFLSLPDEEFMSNVGVEQRQGITEIDKEEALITQIAKWDKNGRPPPLIVLISNLADPNVNRRLARKLVDVDVVLARMETPFEVIKNLAGQDTILAAASLYNNTGDKGSHLGDLQLQVDEEGRVISWNGKQVILTRIYNETTWGSKVWKIAQEELIKFTNQTSNVLGTASVPLDGVRANCRNKECTMGNLATDVMRTVTGTDIAVVNSGAIRDSINAGSVSAKSILTVFQFDSSISVVEVSGAQLRAILEHSVSRVNASDPYSSNGRFLQVSGVQFSWNLDEPVGSRVYDISVWSAAQKQYLMAKDTQVFTMAALDYLVAGGDDYSTRFTSLKKLVSSSWVLQLILNQWFVDHSPVSSQLSERITRRKAPLLSERITRRKAPLVLLSIVSSFPSLNRSNLSSSSVVHQYNGLLELAISHINNHSDGQYDNLFTGGRLSLLTSASMKVCDPAAAVSSALKAAPSASAIIGPDCLDSILEVYKVSAAFGLPQLVVSGVRQTQPQSYLSSMSPSHTGLGRESAALLLALGLQTVGIVFAPSQAYNAEIASSFRKAFLTSSKSKTPIPVSVQLTFPLTADVVAGAVDKLASSKTRIFVLCLDEDSALLFFNQLLAQQVAFSPPVTWVAVGWAGLVPTDKAMEQLLQGALSVEHRHTLLPNLTQAWVAADPTQYWDADGDRQTLPELAAEAYDTVIALAKAAQMALDVGADPRDGRLLNDFLNEMFFEGMSGLVRFDEDQYRVPQLILKNLPRSNLPDTMAQWVTVGEWIVPGDESAPELILEGAISWPGGESSPWDGQTGVELFSEPSCTGAIVRIPESASLCGVSFSSQQTTSGSSDSVVTAMKSARITSGLKATIMDSCTRTGAALWSLSHFSRLQLPQPLCRNVTLAATASQGYLQVEVVEMTEEIPKDQLIPLNAAFLAVNLILAVMSAILVALQRKQFPVKLWNLYLTYALILGCSVICILPLGAVVQVNCNLYFWLYAFGVILFWCGVALSVVNQSLWFHFSDLRMQFLKQNRDTALLGRLQVMRDRLRPRWLATVLLCALPVIIIIYIAVVQSAGSIDNQDRNMHGMCNLPRATHAVVLATIASGFALTAALAYTLRNRQDLSGTLRETLLLLATTMMVVVAGGLMTGLQDKWTNHNLLWIWGVQMYFLVRGVLFPCLFTFKLLRKKGNGTEEQGEPLEDILTTKRGFQFFAAHCRGEFSEENPLFWRAAHNYKSKTSFDKFMEIYERYVSEDSPMMVNLSYQTKKTLDDMAQEDGNRVTLQKLQSIFDAALEEVYEMLKRDTYNRFVSGPLYAMYQAKKPLPSGGISVEDSVLSTARSEATLDMKQLSSPTSKIPKGQPALRTDSLEAGEEAVSTTRPERSNTYEPADEMVEVDNTAGKESPDMADASGRRHLTGTPNLEEAASPRSPGHSVF
eukprot:g61603.t1